MAPTGNGNRPGFRGALRGDGTLPVGELLHPAALLALALLLVNDWVLKPRYGPSWWTGKLSDVAGLIVAPLALSAAIGLVARAHLTHRRLVACIAATGLVFALVKLCAPAASALASLLSIFGRRASIYLDPTDLMTLPSLAIAYAIGRDELTWIASPRAAPRARP